MRKRTFFVGAAGLFVAFGLAGCGGGTIKEGLPADTKPNEDLIRQDQEVGKRNMESLNPSSAPAKK